MSIIDPAIAAQLSAETVTAIQNTTVTNVQDKYMRDLAFERLINASVLNDTRVFGTIPFTVPAVEYNASTINAVLQAARTLITKVIYEDAIVVQGVDINYYLVNPIKINLLTRLTTLEGAMFVGYQAGGIKKYDISDRLTLSDTDINSNALYLVTYFPANDPANNVPTSTPNNSDITPTPTPRVSTVVGNNPIDPNNGGYDPIPNDGSLTSGPGPQFAEQFDSPLLSSYIEQEVRREIEAEFGTDTILSAGLARISIALARAIKKYLVADVLTAPVSLLTGGTTIQATNGVVVPNPHGHTVRPHQHRINAP